MPHYMSNKHHALLFFCISYLFAALPITKADKPPEFHGRGYTIVGHETEIKDLALMKAEGVTLVRWMLFHSWPWKDETDFNEYQVWMHAELIRLDQVLRDCQRLGIQVAIDLHDVPGARYPDSSSLRLFYEQIYNDQFVEVWKKIATRYQGHPALYGFGLMNEPVEAEARPRISDAIQTQIRAAKAIRAVDPDTPIIFSSKAWNGPDPFFTETVPIKNIIYEFHMYQLMEYSHQGIPGFPFDQSYSYPGKMNAAGWQVEKAQLKQLMAKVIAFQTAHPDARIFVGEFSAVRWAGGAARYLEDCISIFEEYGWDWTYHAWTKETHWSLDFENGGTGSKAIPAKEPTDRKAVILKALKP